MDKRERIFWNNLGSRTAIRLELVLSEECLGKLKYDAVRRFQG